MSADGDPRPGQKLTLLDACAMAIGGMVGGGIFSVTAEAINKAGNAAWVSLGIAGLLALVTGTSYSKLTVKYNDSGGSFLYLSQLISQRFAGTVIWFLLVGYVFTNSLYAYTFGAYACSLFGLGDSSGAYFGVGIIALMAWLNLLGLRQPAMTQDLLVYTKVAILLLVIGVGMSILKTARALPVFEVSRLNAISTAALIFVAYEGFELLAFNYADMEDNQRTFPRAIWLSICASIFLYVLAALVMNDVLSRRFLKAHVDTALAYTVKPVLGRAGIYLVMVAAIFSTASAINATIFASSRLARRVAEFRQLPQTTTTWMAGGVPVIFVIVLSAAAAAFQFLGSLHQIVSFSSLVFMLIFAQVNLCAYLDRSFGGRYHIVPALGFLGCLGAAGFLIYDLYTNRPTSLWIIAGIAVLLLVLRFLYIVWYSCCAAFSERER